MTNSNISCIVISDLCSNVNNIYASAYTPALNTNLAEITRWKLSKITDFSVFNDKSESISEDRVLYISPLVIDLDTVLETVLKKFNDNSLTITTENNTVISKITVKQTIEETVKISAKIITSRSELRKFIDKTRIDILDDFYEKGVEIPCYDGVEISPAAEIKPGSIVLSGSKIDSNSKIESGAIIGPNSIISSAKIGANSVINNTVVTESIIENNVKIGPFCQIRPNCLIKSGVKIGDFVEVKNSIVGNDTHASHLTYIGDSDVGARVNFGCGTVTSNYDGINKFRTVIGDDAFIGCNTNLVAPVNIGNNAYTAAGSTITKDVPDGSLAVARSRQTVIDGWAEKRKKKA